MSPLAAWVAIGVAVITTCGTIFAAYFAYRAAARVKTPNGREAGDLVDSISHDVAEIRIWVVEHLRDHANNRNL